MYVLDGSSCSRTPGRTTKTVRTSRMGLRRWWSRFESPGALHIFLIK